MPQTVLELTQQLVATPSVSQDGNTRIMDDIERWLRAAGFEAIERLEYTNPGEPTKANLVARKGQGTGGLALLSHSDTVPGMEESWEPFNPVIKEGRLYGRGSCDMKGPLAATMIAAAQVDAAQLNAPLYIIVTADEEQGLYGAEHVVKHSRMLRDAPPQYGVVAEPTSLIPVYAHKGYARIWVRAYGKSAHTSTDKGRSSTFKMAPFLAEMAQLKALFESDPSFRNDEFTPSTNGFNMTVQDDGKLNVTPARTECALSLRVMPHARTDECIAMITAAAHKYDLEIETDIGKAVYTDKHSPLMQAAYAATGNAHPQTVSYATDGYHFQKLMELMILGPGDIAVAHTNHESIPVEELEAAVGIYQQIIEHLCMGAARA